MAKPLFEISENTPDVTIPLEGTRKYIIPRLINYKKTYDA